MWGEREMGREGRKLGNIKICGEREERKGEIEREEEKRGTERERGRRRKSEKKLRVREGVRKYDKSKKKYVYNEIMMIIAKQRSERNNGSLTRIPQKIQTYTCL